MAAGRHPSAAASMRLSWAPVSDGGNPMRSAFVALTLLALLPLSGGARAQNADLLLVLAADVSRSIDDGEFELQRKGYAAAITDPRVLRAISGGRNHALALSR